MKWEQVCRWVGQSGDGERRESLRAPGGRMENVSEGGWRVRNMSVTIEESKIAPV